MLKPFDTYTLEILSSVNQGRTAMILCYQGGRFAGRIDFFAGQPPPLSYLWHPNGPGNADTTYIVLNMQESLFGSVAEILREEKPFGLELWPSGPMGGAVTDGYGGSLRSLDREPVGEEERRLHLMPRPARRTKGKGGGTRRRAR